MLLAWTREIEKLGPGADGATKVHRFGAGVDVAACDVAHLPLRLAVDLSKTDGTRHTLHVDLIGRTLPRTSEAFLTLSRHSSSDKWAVDRAALRAFVDQAVLVASGAVAPTPYASLLVEGSEATSKTSRVAFDPMSREEATAWIASIVGKLLSEPHDAFLPCEAVFARHATDPGGDLTPHLESARAILASKGRSFLRSAYGPVPNPERYPLPPEAVARTQADILYGAFFAQRKAGA
jgi:hypothetical protein